MDRGSRRGRGIARLAVAAAGVLLALLGGEVLLRLSWRDLDAHYVHWPYTRRVFQPTPVVMPGVEGPSLFAVSSLGLRGDEPSAREDYRILFLGGSTTECLYLDQEEAWPRQVEKRLNAAQTAHRVWAGNAGKSGSTTRDHVLQLPLLLSQVEGVDLVVLLVGVNDLYLRLKQDAGYDASYMDAPGARARQLRSAFELLPMDAYPWHPAWERTALWRLVVRARDSFWSPPTSQDAGGLAYDRWREYRRSASAMRDELPDLTSGLGEYAGNVEQLVATCSDRGVRPLLLTQPTLWREDLPPELVDLLWLGGVGDSTSGPGCEYYTVSALADAMRRYNERLIEVSVELGVECLDLARRVPRDTRSFFDDCHFNESGSELVAEQLTEYLLARAPFSP